MVGLTSYPGYYVNIIMFDMSYKFQYSVQGVSDVIEFKEKETKTHFILFFN